MEATASAKDLNIFGCLLLRHRLMTRVILRCMVLGAVVSCPLCAGEDEDCSYLFFMCLIVQEAWQAVGIARLVASLDEAFWSSLIDGSIRRETDWRGAFAMLWAIWLNRNEVILRGVTPSSDAILHAAGGGGGYMSFPGIEVVQAPRTLCPCNDRLVYLCHYINDIRGHHFRCSPASFKNKNCR